MAACGGGNMAVPTGNGSTTTRMCGIRRIFGATNTTARVKTSISGIRRRCGFPSITSSGRIFIRRIVGITPDTSSFWTCSSPRPLSGENVFDYVGFFDAGKPDVEAAEGIREALVVDAQAVQDRGVHVAEVDGIFGDVV